MNLPDLKKRKWNYLGLSFALPTTLMLVVMFVTSAKPFGDYSMLYSDMYHQYFPFFQEFRRALRSGESLLWNWSAGLGMDYLGLISYYLASPLNLLSVLVPDGWVLEYFSLLMPVKLGLASLFFAIMLKKLFGTDDLSLPLFGAFYGMCAWALGYQWNIMWLDTFALLPLVMLGTVSLLRDKKYILYTLTLALSIFANYYIGYFVCIFVFLFFFCYELCRFRSIPRLFADFFRIAFFSVLAIGMTAILELPALSALQDTYSSINSFPEGFSMNIISGEAVNAARQAWEAFRTAKEAGEETFRLWWDAMRASFPPVLEGMAKVAGNMGGGVTPTFIDGLPNLYCGVFPLALAMLFLLAREVKLRDKLCCGILLLFFAVSFLIRQLDYIWHGFHFTNQIPYRFSFLFSFVLLYMAYRAWLLRDRFRVWQIVAAGAVGLGLLLVDRERRGDASYLAFNLVFLGAYLALMLYGSGELRDSGRIRRAALPEETCAEKETTLSEAPSEEASPDMPVFAEEEMPEAPLLPPLDTRRRQAALAAACLMALELVINVANFAAGFAIGNYDYPKRGAAAQSMFRVMRERPSNGLFYRTEVTHAQTLNDGPLNGYNGISTFSSSANVKVTEFMEALGYAGRGNWNRYCWEESSPVANLFLNLKYMMERDTTPAFNAYFDVLHTYQKVTLMENNAYLPLGFLTDSALAEVDFSKGDAFTLQNQIFSAATGIDGAVWEWVPGQDLKVSAEGDVTVTVENASGYTGFRTGTGGKLTYTYTVTQEGFLCLDLTLYAQKKFSVWHNGAKLYSENYTLPTTMAVCNVVPGDTVEVIVECAAGVTSAVYIQAAVLNDNRFRSGYERLAASTLELLEFSTTRISGIIDCDRDGLLYTSIPQCGNRRTDERVEPDGNWVAYVDGREAEITLVGDAMVALRLSEGVHTVEFRYRNRAFTYGAIISLGCAAIFGGTVLTGCLRRRRKAKQTA